jgi:hypothetical protein
MLEGADFQAVQFRQELRKERLAGASQELGRIGRARQELDRG